jgi:hypothetical protein
MSNILAFQPSVQLVERTCGECGITFGVPKQFDEERRRNHSLGWFCPNGHNRVYLGKTEAEKLRDQLADKDRQLAYERERASTNFTARVKAEAEARRIKKRVSGGACPCCKRSFTNVARHMKTKHPDFHGDAK